MGERAFEQMVLARLIEPASKADTPRVLSEIGWPAPAHRSTLQACLARAQERGYRESLSAALFDHVTASGGLALCLYDLTTLHFETEREDDLRRVGYSKDRRGGPQVIVGLLVDRHGPPPSRPAAGRATGLRPPRSSPWWRPSRPPTASPSSPVVADAGTLSASNPSASDEARPRFNA